MSTYTSTSEVIEQLLLQSFYRRLADCLGHCGLATTIPVSPVQTGLWPAELITKVIAMWVMKVKKSVRAPLHNKDISACYISAEHVIYLETPGDHHNDHC